MRIFEELELGCNDGTIDCPDALVRLLFYGHLGNDQLEEAWDVLRRHRPAGPSPYGSLCETLMREERDEEALVVLALAEEVGLDPDVFLEEYLILDRTRAVELLQTRIEGESTPRQRSQDLRQLATLLVRRGQRDQALARLLELDESEFRSRDTLGILSRLDPERAELELKRLHGEGEREPWSVILLAKVLHDLGRAEESSRELEHEYRTGPHPEYALTVMADRFPERAFELLEGHSVRLDRGESADLWWEIGHGLKRTDVERAGEAWLRALDQGAWMDEDDIEFLATHRPRDLCRVLLQIEGRYQRENDCCEWAEYAGFLWIAGQEEHAVRAWRRAVGLDPEDEEHAQQLAAALEGRDPFDV